MEFSHLWDTKTVRFEKARAMYLLNKSFREIASEVNIPRSTLHRRALAENWKKGSLLPLVYQMVEHEILFQQLTPDQRTAVENIIRRKQRLQELYKENPNPWLKKLMK